MSGAKPWRGLAGVVLALVAFEILLRGLASGSPTLDATRGWVYRETTVRHLLSEGHGVSHWDAAGIRHSPSRPANPSMRFLAIGDSMTEALQVSDAEVYTARLEDAVQQGGWPAAVLNAGRSSLSAADYIAGARSYVDEFRPTWTIVQLRMDDLTTDSRDPGRTHFVERDGQLAVEVVPPRFGRRSALLGELRRASALVDQTVARASIFNASARLPPMFRGGGNASESAPPAAEPDYPIEEELSMLAAAWEGRLTIALIPNATTLPGAVERRALAYGRRHGISMVDFREVFPQFDRRRSSPFGFSNSVFGVGHLNGEGHDALAGLLANELKDLRALGLF
jgi:hypothetical protein